MCCGCARVHPDRRLHNSKRVVRWHNEPMRAAPRIACELTRSVRSNRDGRSLRQFLDHPTSPAPASDGGRAGSALAPERSERRDTPQNRSKRGRAPVPRTALLFRGMLLSRRKSVARVHAVPCGDRAPKQRLRRVWTKTLGSVVRGPGRHPVSTNRSVSDPGPRAAPQEPTLPIAASLHPGGTVRQVKCSVRQGDQARRSVIDWQVDLCARVKHPRTLARSGPTPQCWSLRRADWTAHAPGLVADWISIW